MKKLFLLISMLVISGIIIAQNMVTNPSFEDWNNGTPNGWLGSKSNIGATNVVQYTTSSHTGSSACQLINETNSHKRFTTGAMPLEAGQSYQISFWVRGAGEIRTGLYDATSGQYGYTEYNPYITVNSTEWTQHTQTVTSEGSVTNGEFIFSLRNTVSGNDHLQIDDVEITGGTVSLMANFTADATMASPGTTIRFQDLSTGNPTSWEWNIVGAETMTSTEQHPEFTFNMVGTYDVSLTVSNGTETNTKEEEGYIVIATFIINQDWNDLQWKGWSQVNVIGEQTWVISETYGIDNSPCIKMSGYSGSPFLNEDWLISPAFEISANENTTLSFYTAYKYDGNPLQLFISNDYNGDPESATWQELQFTPSAGNFSWTHSGNINLEQFAGNQCFLGFKYTSSEQAAATWEIDNIVLFKETAAIAENQSIDFQLSPNPCNGQFFIKMAEKATVSVYDILGKMIYQQTNEDNAYINLGNVPSGIYIVKIQNENGAAGTCKIIVQ